MCVGSCVQKYVCKGQEKKRGRGGVPLGFLKVFAVYVRSATSSGVGGQSSNSTFSLPNALTSSLRWRHSLFHQPSIRRTMSRCEFRTPANPLRGCGRHRRRRGR